MNASLESLEKKYGKEAPAMLREIVDLGGYGQVGEGGCDIASALADSNKAISSKSKDRIAEIMGVSRAHATGVVDDKTGSQSSAHKMRAGSVEKQNEINERLRKQREKER